MQPAPKAAAAPADEQPSVFLQAGRSVLLKQTLKIQATDKAAALQNCASVSAGFSETVF